MENSQDLLDQLNPRQKEAVTWPSGPVLVLAGAGSGKTRVLTHRIAYLLGPCGVPPGRVLAVTFTNKAAQEMAERVKRLLGGRKGPPWLGTFHSVCVRILRRDGQRVGCPPNFTIYDRDDSIRVVKEILKELALSERDFNARGVMSKISGAKNAMVSPHDYPCPDTYTRQLVRIYSLYNDRLARYNALDFDDLLIKVVELFAQEDIVRSRYRERFQHILVDEYQDTNRAQYLIVKYLAGEDGNVFVVGDDDQSIYGFRGADLNNILDFEKDFDNVKTIRLEQNYRSTKLILEAASRVVSNNVGRMGKELWTRNSKGDRIVLLQALDEEEEAEMVCENLYRSGRNLRDFVILYRTNAQSRPLEETFRRRGIPYVVVGGVRFYERKEVKDILAYMRLIVNTADTVSLKRILNVPPRGLGPAMLARLEDSARERGLSIYDAILNAEEIRGLKPRHLSALKEFTGIIEKGRACLEETGAAELMSRVIQDTEYLDLLMAERTREAESRVDNVRELLASASSYEERAADRTARGFLAEVSLFTDIDGWNDKQEAVSLMTVHNAKGLEFPVVFVTGMEDGLFPHSNSFDSPAGLEEERRLFYVSLTRAQQKAYLSFATQRTRYGGAIASFPSRFIREIPETLLEVEAAASSALDAGAIVRHPDWGLARVLRVEGDGEDARALLRFEAGFDKLVVLKYAGLVRVNQEELWE